MSRLEKLSDSFLRVGRHPFKACMRRNKSKKNQHDFEQDDDDTQACCCCHTDSAIYARFWPAIFFFSALTDFPMPLPKGKRPGQHREWGWMPVMIVIGLVAFVSYGYIDRIILLLLWEKKREAQALVYLVFFCIFLMFFFISYARIVSKQPGQPKNTEKNTDESTSVTVNLVDSSSHIPTKPISILGSVKWCKICQTWKPDRAHHCRVCDSCVLKMDHHCPWVNGCVGVSNYRFYIQFLFYVTLLGTWVFATSLAAFIQFNSLFTFDGIALAILVISGIVTFVIGSFTLSHIWLVLLNRTTIENSSFQHWKKARKAGTTDGRLIDTFTETGKNVFNQGYRDNWIEVMGNNKLLWFVPLGLRQNERDGIHFGFNEEILAEYLNEDMSRRSKTLKNKPN